MIALSPKEAARWVAIQEILLKEGFDTGLSAGEEVVSAPDTYSDVRMGEHGAYSVFDLIEGSKDPSLELDEIARRFELEALAESMGLDEVDEPREEDDLFSGWGAVVALVKKRL